MACPYVSYKNEDDEHEFEHERPYCEVTESFVEPLRADICNDIGRLSHEANCEIYRETVQNV